MHKFVRWFLLLYIMRYFVITSPRQSSHSNRVPGILSWSHGWCKMLHERGDCVCSRIGRHIEEKSSFRQESLVQIVSGDMKQHLKHLLHPPTQTTHIENPRKLGEVSGFWESDRNGSVRHKCVFSHWKLHLTLVQQTNWGPTKRVSGRVERRVEENAEEGWCEFLCMRW